MGGPEPEEIHFSGNGNLHVTTVAVHRKKGERKERLQNFKENAKEGGMLPGWKKCDCGRNSQNSGLGG